MGFNSGFKGLKLRISFVVYIGVLQYYQKRIKPGHIATKFLIKEGPNICGPYTRHLYLVILLAPKLLWWRPDF